MGLTGLAFRGKVQMCRAWQGAFCPLRWAWTVSPPSVPHLCVHWTFLQGAFGWTEWWSLQTGWDWPYGGPNSPDRPTVSQATYLGDTEPHPASCVFHEWMRKHLQMTWLQSPHQLCWLFWVSLIAFGSTWYSVFHQISPFSMGVFIMCHFESRRDTEQSSSKTIKHFIIQDGEGTGLTYNTGSNNGRKMWY